MSTLHIGQEPPRQKPDEAAQLREEVERLTLALSEAQKRLADVEEDREARRHSLAQEISECLKVRGYFTPGASRASDLIGAVARAIDAAKAEGREQEGERLRAELAAAIRELAEAREQINVLKGGMIDLTVTLDEAQSRARELEAEVELLRVDEQDPAHARLAAYAERLAFVSRRVLSDAKWLADVYEQHGIGALTPPMRLRFQQLDNALAAKPESLEIGTSADARDAARYRYLRSTIHRPEPGGSGLCIHFEPRAGFGMDGEPVEEWMREHMDAAIDRERLGDCDEPPAAPAQPEAPAIVDAARTILRDHGNEVDAAARRALEAIADKGHAQPEAPGPNDDPFGENELRRQAIVRERHAQPEAPACKCPPLTCEQRPGTMCEFHGCRMPDSRPAQGDSGLPGDDRGFPTMEEEEDARRERNEGFPSEGKP